MVIVLSIITGLCYISGFVAMMSALAHSTVFQDISSSISFVCGTIALAGAGIIHQLVKIKERLPEPRPVAPAVSQSPA